MNCVRCKGTSMIELTHPEEKDPCILQCCACKYVHTIYEDEASVRVFIESNDLDALISEQEFMSYNVEPTPYQVGQRVKSTAPKETWDDILELDDRDNIIGTIVGIKILPDTTWDRVTCPACLLRRKP